MKLYQKPAAGYYQGFTAELQHVGKVQLEAWDGYVWQFRKDITNLQPDVWFHDYAVAKTLWRLVADSIILDGIDI